MVNLRDGLVTSRPIAGTRRRGRTPEEDAELAEELLADPKERAEHVMLVDLARNDVGRVACFGTEAVEDFMVIERYSHVMHIVSSVTGRLRDGLDPVDVLCATFPHGTVSGAPKVRAMEIIDQLEPVRRGVYAGLVGYVDFAGNMDTCIALRTMVVKDGMAYVQAGGGVVADSDPVAEDQECHHKAQALLTAVAVARGLRQREEVRAV
jgi:anthranilate synthase component 1